MVQLEPGFCSKTSWIQIGYGLWVHVPLFSVGLVFGFPSVAVPELTAPESPIKFTLAETAWFASVVTLTAPIGCIVCGYLTDRFGRRVIIIVCQANMAIGWLYTYFSHSPLHINIGRALSGIAVGMATGPPRVYATEISLPKMRGVIGAFPNVAQSLGLTFHALLGTLFRWRVLCFIYGTFSIGFFFINMFLPETPYYVLMKSSVDEAKDALKKFRSKSYDVNQEINELIEFKVVNQIRSLTCKEEMHALFKPSACKPFGIIIPYLLMTQLSGVSVLIFYAVEMFEDSRSLVSPHTGNVLLGVTRLLSGIAVSLLLYRLGRRTMALISCIGVGVVSISLGLHIIYTEDLSAFPPTCFISYIIFASCGHYTLPFLLMYELYPLQIRGLLGGISTSILNIMVFAVAKAYPFVRQAIGFQYTVIGFGVSSLLGSIYVYFFMPETRNLTLQEIEEYFNKRRSTMAPLHEMQQAQMRDSERHLSENRLHSKRSLTRHKLNSSQVINDSSSTLKDTDVPEERKDGKNRTDDNGPA